MDIALLILALLAGAHLMQFIFPVDNRPHHVSPRLIIWRWIFLCALTVQATLLSMQMMLTRGTAAFAAFKFFDYPHLDNFLGGLHAVSTLFLLFASPFFFRRLRPWAILSWVTAVLSTLWMLPNL